MIKPYIRQLIDLLLRLVPGSRFDPNSLESRVRRVSDATTKAVEAAIATETAVRAAVKADAEKAAAAAWETSHAASAKAKALDRIATTVVM
jgi:hypothetical protein